MAAVLSYQANDSDGTTISAGSSYTFPLTVASASGQRRAVMLASVAELGITGFSAVTIDGQSAALRGSVDGGDDSNGAQAFVRCYVADGTSGTSINVVATITGSGQAFAGYCALWTLSDSDGAAFDTATGASITPTLDLDTQADSAVLAAFYGYDGTSASVGSLAWTGVTERFDGVTVFGDEVFSGADESSVAAATPRAVSATASNLIDNRPNPGFSVCALAVSFSPTAAGGARVVGTGLTESRQLQRTRLVRASRHMDGWMARGRLIVPRGLAA